jgi:hypothetical protein
VKPWTVALVLLLLPRLLVAQTLADYDYENLEFRGIGLELGGVWPTRAERTLSFGIRADMGLVGPNVRISPAARFWSSRLRQAEVDRLGDQIVRVCRRQPDAVCPERLDLGEVSRSDLEIGLDANYLFDPGWGIVPYAGAGLSLHLLNGRGEFINDTFVEDLLDTLAPGLNLMAGLSLPLGTILELVSEARFVLVSDVQYLNVILGGTWQLPTPRSPFRASNPGVR